jgi:molecular chaperone Hsp33
VPGDLASWRISSSPSPTEESSPSGSSSSDSLSEILEPYRNKNNLDDQVFSAMSADGGLKVTVATIRNLLNEMMIQHSMNPVPGGKYTL